MRQEPNNRDYYNNLAVTEARKLVAKIRADNDFPNAPQSGADLRVMPVYEEEYENKPVSSLFKFAKEITQVSIEGVAQEYNHLAAYYIEYAIENVDHPETSISRRIVVSKQNYCWARFYLCKELMHCFVHDTGEQRENSCTNTLDGLSTLIEELLLRSSGCGTQTLVDEAAYYGALEFMMPDDTLPILAAVYKTLADTMPGQLDQVYGVIAHLIRVPELFVKYKLGKYIKGLETY